MRCISTNKAFYCTLIFGLYLLQSCTDRRSATPARTIEHRKFYTIDLFQEQVAYDNAGKMSPKEAFANSPRVIRTAHLKLVDYSNERGVKPFYIYQVDQGKFEKSGDARRSKFPVLFLSRQELFKGKVLRDSVYLFLGQLRQYQVLQLNAGIKYEWIDEAPFLPY